MALEYKLASLEGVAENLQTLYVKTDDGYQLDVSGAAPKEKVDSFRDNNIELTNKMASIESKLAGLDIEKFDTIFQTVQRMAQTEADVEMNKALEGGPEAVTALIESRAAERANAMKTDFDTKLTESNTTSNKYRAQLEDAKITAELMRLAAEKGVRTTAVDDVLLRGKQVFKLSDEGEVVAIKDGNVVFNKENQPLSINEYMNELASTAPHLFEGSSGGGAANSGRAPATKGGFEYRGKSHDYSK